MKVIFEEESEGVNEIFKETISRRFFNELSDAKQEGIISDDESDGNSCPFFDSHKIYGVQMSQLRALIHRIL